MKSYIPTLALTAAMMFGAPTAALAQNRSPADEAAEIARRSMEAQKEMQERVMRERIASIKPLKVQVVISNYQGDKKISSAPYTLAVNANDGTTARLRMAVQVPLPMANSPVIDGQPTVYTGAVTYKDIGTLIDCEASTLGEGLFQLKLSIEDSSLYGAKTPVSDAPMTVVPAIRSFKLSNTAFLKDGQSTQFTTATDRISGEITKIDVTLTVVK